MQRIYLDYAATTPTDPAVVQAMLPYFHDAFGNPSAIYSYGQEAKNALEEARGKSPGLSEQGMKKSFSPAAAPRRITLH